MFRRTIFATLVGLLFLLVVSPTTVRAETSADSKPTTTITVTPTVVIFKGPDGKTSTTTTIPTPGSASGVVTQTAPAGPEKGKNTPPMWFGLGVGLVVGAVLSVRFIALSPAAMDLIGSARQSTYRENDDA